ncbi:PAS domain S-box protein [Geomonas sp. RF6]|uniref:hybrid sensor histidine kinase/response regulator n=1 Tax=Geomonas sp. RF6 TaxID=2897342 RepID=UPI001E3DE7A8|nr:hybrid sensor histidine kinase/response regulator [Geomonas sp. RF6]UFS71333.1 PAS domain S-box protein [Geomonas sp. RF6]
MSTYLTILLVDDTADNWEWITREIRKSFEGVTMQRVTTEREFFGALEERSFDLVISEYRLKWSSGIEVLRRVKSRLPGCPVLICTAAGGEEVANEALREGADLFLHKSERHLACLPLAVRSAVERAKLAKTHGQLQQLAAIVESSDDAIISFDMEGTITSWNRGAERIYGYGREEVVGASVRLLVPQEQREELEEIMAGVRRGEHVEHLETLRVTKEGAHIHMLVTISPILDEQGRVTGASSVGTDITYRKNLESQLHHAQKMEALGTLSGGIAHDFNNILTAIMGHATIMSMKLESGEAIGPHLQQILEATERAATLTQSLLAFSRKKPSQTEPVDLNQVIAKVENLLVQLMREDVDFRWDTDGSPLNIIGNAGQLEQVVVNLVTNARDALPSGGAIRLQTSRVRLDQAFVHAHGYGTPGSYASLLFSDNGTGMDEATRQRIFEPFFTTKEVGKGTGLGLSITYGIIKQHGGFINCYSEPGRGTTFQIYLPMTRTQAHEEEAAEPREVLPRGSETILLVEDDEATRQMNRQLLENFGYRIIEAVDGVDAVQKFLENPEGIDLVFIDAIMPKKSGRDAFRDIARIRPEVKVLFTSGYAADIYEDGDHVGPNFIAKPVMPTQLIKRVRQLLDD